MIQPHFSRTRERSDGRYHLSNHIRNYHYGNNPGDIGVETTTVSRYHEDYLEHMEDCINPYSSRGFRSPGPCYSYKVRRTGPISVDWSDTFDSNTYVTRHDDVDFAHYDLRQVVSFLPSVPASLLADNRLASFTKMNTQIPTDVSIPNFLLELADFKESFAHYKKAVTKRGLRIKDVPGWANSTFLDFNFNLLPFVGDMIKITQVYDRVAKRIDFLKRNRGMPVRQSFYNGALWDENPHVGTEINRNIHSGPFYTEGYNPVPPYDWYMGNQGGTDHQYGYTSLKLIDYRASFSASWILVQDLVGLDDAWAQLRGLIAGTGFNNPAKIIWNAIPFSFIVDWMVPFGKALDLLAVQPFYGKWDVYDVCNSVKETAVIEQDRVYSGYQQGYEHNRNLITVQRYSRWLGLDLDVSSFDPTDLTKQQQSLLASLAANLTLFKSGKKH